MDSVNINEPSFIAERKMPTYGEPEANALRVILENKDALDEVLHGPLPTTNDS